MRLSTRRLKVLPGDYFAQPSAYLESIWRYWTVLLHCFFKSFGGNASTSICTIFTKTKPLLRSEHVQQEPPNLLLVGCHAQHSWRSSRYNWLIALSSIAENHPLQLGSSLLLYVPPPKADIRTPCANRPQLCPACLIIILEVLAELLLNVEEAVPNRAFSLEEYPGLVCCGTSRNVGQHPSGDDEIDEPADYLPLRVDRMVEVVRLEVVSEYTGEGVRPVSPRG